MNGREDIVVEMRNIVKYFPGVLANDHVNFELRKGEIHALLGENGAGKTTLMNILYGIYQPDEGEIFVRGKKVKINSPKDAIELGIGMVHQHFMLVDVFSVAENIALGLKGLGFFLSMSKIKKMIERYSSQYGLDVDPDAKIWQLSAGEKQRVEIIKALIRGAEILILDEPTSIISPSEIKSFFKVLRSMVSDGKSIVFITHKLNEVLEIGDRVTVLRKGRVVSSTEVSKTDIKKLARDMIGRDIEFAVKKDEVKKGDTILELRNVKVIGDKGNLVLKGINLDVKSGEIHGIAGVSGNGQRELVEAITGLRKVLDGRIILMGKDVTNKGYKLSREFKIAHIPEDRLKVGIVPSMSIMENAILRSYFKDPFSKCVFDGKFKILIDENYVENYVNNLIEEYEIKASNIRAPAGTLSGGNIQRLIVARELSSNPKLVIASHPTYGLDISATEFIRRALLNACKNGAGVLLISEDLDEIMMLSDRISVIFNGEILGTFDAKDADLDEISLLMAGVKTEVVK
ncbi:MAG: ABC transporter ATP-binding protein [Candidatus Asgardarchaeia archaeon]